jgi:acetolactate synthase-1/2/3 large subunit
LADGYTRIKCGKRNGVFAAQAGPGIENAFPGVAQAFSENVPLLMIPAGLSLARQYVRPVFRAADVYRPVTKWSALAHSVQELPDLMRRAYHAMRSGKGGPVLIEVPAEVWEAEYAGELDYAPVPVQRAAPDPDAVKTAVRMLLAAKHPLLLAGQGVLYAQASDRLAALAELIPAPVLTTNPGKSAIPETHPLALGASTRSRPKMVTEFMAKADLVLAVGSSLTRTPFGPSVPAGKTIIHATNDAADINKEYRVDHAVIGDAALVLDAIIAEVDRQKGAGGANALASLKEEVAAAKKAWLAEWDKHLNSEEVPINQYRVIRDLMRSVDRDNVIITHDSGGPREQLLPFWETTAPGSYMGWGKSTQLGYGSASPWARSSRRRRKLCVNIMGDASIGMTGMDIETGGPQSHRHSHHRVQQRRHGGRTRCARALDQEIRRADDRRQLHQGSRGPQRCRDADRKAGRHRAGDQGRRARHRNGRAVPVGDPGQGRLRLLALPADGAVAEIRGANWAGGLSPRAGRGAEPRLGNEQIAVTAPRRSLISERLRARASPRRRARASI